ncbi:hypothetical protein SAMN05192541_125146 [Bradyrhizobium arachidis]|nr:hypothetical protein SAMN05192541_125146 [Bradyrhizobium arachidis]
MSNNGKRTLPIVINAFAGRMFPRGEPKPTPPLVCQTFS